MTTRGRGRLVGRYWLGTYVVLIVAGVVGIAIVANRGMVRPVLPTSFGQGSKCYYVRSPAEAAQLKRAGDCMSASVPAPMPASWLILYYPFYNSRYYAGTFVAPDAQAGYRTYLQTFDGEYSAQISEEAPTAEYVDSSGDEVSGAKAGLNASATEIADDSSSDGYGDPGAGADDDQGGSDDGGDGGGSGDDGGDGGDDGGGGGGGGDGGD